LNAKSGGKKQAKTNKGRESAERGSPGGKIDQKTGFKEKKNPPSRRTQILKILKIKNRKNPWKALPPLEGWVSGRG